VALRQSSQVAYCFPYHLLIEERKTDARAKVFLFYSTQKREKKT
jgi:hypothetical protein